MKTMKARHFIRVLACGLTLLSLALLAKADVRAIVNQVSQSSYQNYLDNQLYTHLGQDRGTPVDGHWYFGAAHDAARANIQKAFESFGLVTRLDAFDPGFGPGNGSNYVNVVGQITGTTRPNDVYIVGAHYDSVSNPGADDNASGVAGVIEAARVLSQYRFEATLRFIAFDGEETEIYGSKHYASAKPAGENYLGMVALDMIANNRFNNEVEVVGVEGALTSGLVSSLSNYGGLTGVFGGQDKNSDHYSFTEKGFPAALLFERNGGSNAYYHGPSDSVDTANYIDYAYATKITQAAVGYFATQAGLVGDRPPPKGNPSDNTWTILIYAHGDHNLSPNLMLDLNEMEQTGSGDGFNIVVQADFNASVAISGLPKDLASGVTRFLIQKDNDPSNFTTPAVERLPESNNMDDPKTLTSFISWGVQKYPARRYGLILWDHGGQYQGFGGDTQDGTIAGGGLSTAQIRQALTAAMPGGGITKWEFLAFDTCLMGGVEVLPDMVPLTDVFIACPELDFGDGWDYAASLNYLKTNPGVTALEFGIQEAKTWQDHHLRPENAGDLALAAHAVYDLTQYADFSQKFDAFGERLTQAYTPSNSWIPQTRLQTTAYSVQAVADAGKPTTFIDVGEFAQRLAQNSAASTELRQAAEAMVASLRQMVSAKVMGTLKTNALGLSVYYPVTGSADDALYAELTFAKQPGATWPKYLAAIVPGNSQGRLTLVPEGDIDLTITDNQPAEVRFAVSAGPPAYSYRASVVDHQMAGQSNSVVYLGEVFLSPAQAGKTYQLQWNGTLPALVGDSPAEAVWFGGFTEDTVDQLSTGYAEYTPPGLTKSQSVVLLAQISAAGTGRILQALDADAFDDNMGPSGIDLEPGGTLKPVYYLERREGDDPDQWTGDDFFSTQVVTVPSSGITGLHLVMKAVPPGLYTLEVQVTDVYDETSDPLVYQVTVKPPGPSLQIAALANGGLKVTWPSTATGFVPQSTANLHGGTWSDLPTNEITSEGDHNQLILSRSAAIQFYRLVKK